jgi:hypothetical protein
MIIVFTDHYRFFKAQGQSTIGLKSIITIYFYEFNMSLARIEVELGG